MPIESAFRFVPLSRTTRLNSETWNSRFRIRDSKFLSLLSESFERSIESSLPSKLMYLLEIMLSKFARVNRLTF